MSVVLALPDSPPVTANEAAELAPALTGSTGVKLIAGDNLRALRLLEPSSVAMAYLDPPFFTQKVHHRTTRKRNKGGVLVRLKSRAFDDRWESLEAYLMALRERIVAVRESLRDDGCAVIHIDSATSHYIKVMCDAIFGRRAFSSEIIWRYRRWPAKTPNFQRMHDVLLRYQKNPDVPPTFNQLYEPLAPSTLATWGKKKQRAQYNKEGRRCRSSLTREDSPGTPMGDVWEIGVIAPVAKERTGYPTQKPLKLLNRLVEALTNPGDTVLDPYCGSGTTLVAAQQLGRNAIGIDLGEEALSVAATRLAEKDIVFTKHVVRTATSPDRHSTAG